MQTTVNVVCYKSKTLSNGEHPLMLRLCQGSKLKYISLKLSVHPQYWDFIKNTPKKNCPNKELIQTLINNKIKEYSEKIIEFKVIEKEFTIATLVEKVNTPIKTKTVRTLFEIQIQRLENARRKSYANTFKQTLSSLLKYKKNLDIYFSDIDISWLKGYEAFLRASDLAENTLGIRFRTLRVIYNIAIEENYVKQEYYPFRKYKVSKLREETIKRALTKEDIFNIINYKSDNYYTKLGIDIFFFSYLLGGINFKDMAYLTDENIIDGRLIYTRRKTKKLIKLPLQEKSMGLIMKYKNLKSPYLFPILSPIHKTDVQKANRIHKVIAKVNECLKAIGRELGLPIVLTTYVARHSYATVLKRSGVATSIISESLGHSSEKITQIYLDSFDNEQIDEAMKNLL
ncbi:MAG: site-specific integrase [Prevotella sp.]|nr:site-specific integrase [Prevotella sp.]